MQSSLKLGMVFGMAALALGVAPGVKAQSLGVGGYIVTYGGYGFLPSPTPISFSDEQNHVFHDNAGGFVGSSSDTVFAAADYGTLHAVSTSDINLVNIGAIEISEHLNDGAQSYAIFNDSVYLAPTAGQLIGTPITLSVRTDVTASFTLTGSSPSVGGSASYNADFELANQSVISVSDLQTDTENIAQGSPTGTFDAFIGEMVPLYGQLIAESGIGGNMPGQATAIADVGNTAHFYLSAPGVSIIGLSGHDYAPPAGVPEASTTVSLGLLLALGLSGVIVAAKRKKTTA